MSYLERWWRDASGTKKESFINLVQNGQLEIVGGGWVMNDEVNSFGLYEIIFCHNLIFMCKAEFVTLFRVLFDLLHNFFSLKLHICIGELLVS